MRGWMRRLRKMTKVQMYVLIYQITSLFPLLYIFTVSGQTSLLAKPNVVTGIYETGMAALPRLEVWLLSLLYRGSLNELWVYFAILGAAFVFGMVTKRLEEEGSERTRAVSRLVYAVLIGCDLLLRLLPLRVNTVQGMGYRIAGFLIRAVCLGLVVWEMKKHPIKKKAAVVLCLLCLAGSAFASGCGKAQPEEKKAEEQTSEEPPATLENRVSACEITGYKPYAGEHGDMFLAEGDKIAVITPSAIASEEQVDAVVEGLKAWGYEPVEGKHVREKSRTLQDCLEDLEWALKDPEIKALFCVRGGYAASEVMDQTPVEWIADAKKLIIGYSDITIYHSAWSTAGLPSVHASMSGAFTVLPQACAEAEEKMLRGELPSYKCESNEFCREGSAEGILIGGNLTTLISALQTAYDCTRTEEPFILVLEMVEETIQRQHRFLTLLKHLGVLEKAQGIVFAELTDTPADFGASDYDGLSRGGAFTCAEDMICRQFLEDLKIPVAFGFPAGHGEMNYPLLLGEKVHLEVTEDFYTLEY